MNKIIGLICGWGCEDFIESALSQAIDYCDEVLVNISPHAEILRKYYDHSYDIAWETSKLYDKVKYIEYDRPDVHANVKATILNIMLAKADLFEEGNWVWTLDVDEFYTQKTYDYILKTIATSPYNKLLMQEKYFYINMRRFLYGEHYRLFRIEDFHTDDIYKYQWFKPTQNWSHHKLKVGTIPIIPAVCDGMFHYGMLTNPWQKIDFWKNEYKGKSQDIKTEWISKIYKYYDLYNEKMWVDENEKLFGIRSPWFSDSFRPNIDGELFKYNGMHPKFIHNNLINIPDFRKRYEF